MGKRKRREESSTDYVQNNTPELTHPDDEEEDKSTATDDVKYYSIPGLSVKPGLRKKLEKRLIVILERANMESIKAGKSYELLNCDDHLSAIRKYKKDLANCRPDILHQCLLMLQDSPLNQAGLLQVYIHTEKNVLIEVHPQCRIPRTFRRFAGLMVQLLHKFNVKAADGGMRLLKVIKNPIEDHLPVGCKKIGMSFSSSKLIEPRELVPPDEPIAFVIGAMAHGKTGAEYVEEEYSISKYHLSAALTCAKICSSFEEVWGIK